MAALHSMKAYLPALLLFPAATLASDTFSTWMRKGDQLDAQLKTREALSAFLEAEKLAPSNAEVLHKIAKQYGEMQNDVTSKGEKKALGETALSYAKRSVAADPKNADAHLALAVCYARVAPFLDNKTKISYSKLVKEHVDRSLQLNPRNDLAHHVLGAWNYELANLNPVLRGIAQLIYGSLPKASNEAAVSAFEKAIELNPRRAGNWVELGRTYAAMGRKDEARKALEKGVSLPIRQRDDTEARRRAQEALKKL
jgi:tetratricopeptide (TPR) repeat protein